MTDSTQRLDELESRLAFQDDTVQALNEIVTRQQLEIDTLQQQLRLIAQSIEALRGGDEGGASAHDERPPHY